jgi:hypothetical protein
MHRLIRLKLSAQEYEVAMKIFQEFPFRQTLVNGGRLFAACLAFTFALSADCNAQKRFKTPTEATEVLADAAKAGDMNVLIAILGREGRDIVISGDPVADKTAAEKFATSYNNKHQVIFEGDKKAVLIIGDRDWPFPIPVVRDGDAWKFDAAAGREEILFRRIGRNELNTIQVCLAYVDAQNEYAAMNPQGVGQGIYAQRIISSAGKKDGLYWPTEPDEAQSPLGELVAAAASQGYGVGKGPIPYHGYYFRILTEQGASAPGGAVDYVVRGKMIGGFALVAYPAEYRNSGVMTFVVNHAGEVFQKDLGRETLRIASRITEFNPDKTWGKASLAIAN